MRTADYAEYDLFIGMDDENIRDMRRILKGDPQGKVHKLLEYSDGGDADSANSVADPWFTGDFETTYEDVVRGARRCWRICAKRCARFFQIASNISMTFSKQH